MNPKEPHRETLAGISLKTMLLTLFALLMLGIYIGVVVDGENSVTVWYELKQKQAHLEQQKRHLQEENMKLQRFYIELKQFEPKE